MSIATKLYNLIFSPLYSGIENIYTKISDKGGTIPTTKNIENVPSAIESIPSGSVPTDLINLIARTGTSITIPNAISVLGASSLRYYRTLVECVLPNTIVSIGDSAFRDDTYLSHINIPKSVTLIEASAFYGVGQGTQTTIFDFTDFTESDNVPSLPNKNAFATSSTNTLLCFANQQVLDKFRNATNWSSIETSYNYVHFQVGIPT